jgi:hypothetical protein
VIVKGLLAGALALALSSAQQAIPAQTTPTFVNSDYIEYLKCDEGSGTGFKLSDGRWVTANHVARMTNCQIDGLPIAVIASDEAMDYAIFLVPGDDRRGGYAVDCAGYVDHRWYHAQGHALGLPVIRSLPIMYLPALDDIFADRGWKTLIYNRVIPGQSGGPIIDSVSGEVVGIVNAYSPIFLMSFSIELKETPICQP